MLSAKQLDYEALADVCSRMAEGEHLHREGLMSIVRIVSGMNPSGKRRFDPNMILYELSEMKA
jgi:hypothetical protein